MKINDKELVCKKCGRQTIPLFSVVYMYCPNCESDKKEPKKEEVPELKETFWI